MRKPNSYFEPNPWYELMVAAEQCAVDLEASIKSRYEGTMDSLTKARYERDMEPVERVRAAVENAMK